MNIQKNQKNGFLIAGVIMFLIFGGNLLMLFNQRSDIWWTPGTMMKSLAETSDQVAIYLNGKPLSEIISAGNLLLKTETGTVEVQALDIGFRMNNWYEVRSMMMTKALTATAFFTVSVLFILYWFISMRKENKPGEIPVKSA